VIEFQQKLKWRSLQTCAYARELKFHIIWWKEMI